MRPSLTPSQTRSLALVIILALFIIPLTTYTTLQQIRDRSKASEEPITSPISSPDPNCPIINKTIYLYPPLDYRGTCHNLQAAINSIPDGETGYTIFLNAGNYYFPRIEPFSISIRNKTNLTITGDGSLGNNAVLLEFGNDVSPASGGIEIINSSVIIEWLHLSAFETTNGLISTSNSPLLQLGYVNISHQGANTVNLSQVNQFFMYNTNISGGVNGIRGSNIANLSISNNQITVSDNAIDLDDTSGTIMYNLLKDNGASAVNAYFYSPQTLTIYGNTIINNNHGTSDGAISLHQAKDSTLFISRNILVNNDYGLLVNPILITVPSSISITENDFFNNYVNFKGIPSQTGIHGNISSDPLLDPNRFCLLDGSPAILPNNNFMGHRGPCNLGQTDINHDGLINIQDYNKFPGYYGKSDSQSQLADLNHDGYVDYRDLQMFIQHFR